MNKARQVTVTRGKGRTGRTIATASLGAAAGNSVLVGCVSMPRTCNYCCSRKSKSGIGPWCGEHGIAVVGRIPSDQTVTKAMVAVKPVVEHGPSLAGDETRKGGRRY